MIFQKNLRVKKTSHIHGHGNKQEKGRKSEQFVTTFSRGKTVEWKNFAPIDITFDIDHRLLTAKIRLSGKERYKNYVRMRMKPLVTLFPPKSKVSNSQNDQNEYLRIIKESIEEGKREKKEKKIMDIKSNIQDFKQKS